MPARWTAKDETNYRRVLVKAGARRGALEGHPRERPYEYLSRGVMGILVMLVALSIGISLVTGGHGWGALFGRPLVETLGSTSN